MSKIGRFAVFALIIDDVAELIRSEQYYLTSLTGNSIALGFPVHITLKGRLFAYEDIVEKIFERTCLNCLRFYIHPQATIHLCEPKYISSELSWLEVLSNSEGFWALHHLHYLFEKELKQFIIEDEVPQNHKYSGFHPHITLGWGITPESWQDYLAFRKFSLKQTLISHIALARYHKDWPVVETIDLILKISV